MITTKRVIIVMIPIVVISFFVFKNFGESIITYLILIPVSIGGLFLMVAELPKHSKRKYKGPHASLLNTIREEIDNLSTDYPRDMLGLGIIIDHLIPALDKDREEIANAIYNDNISVKTWIHASVHNISIKLILSGEYDYHGSLNPHGYALFNMFKQSLVILHELLPEEFTDEKIKEQKKIISQRFKEKF